MASQQTFSTSDLRSAAQDYKRDSTQRHKWALGAVEARGSINHSRPKRPEEVMYTWTRRSDKMALDKTKQGGRAGHVRKLDMLEGTAAAAISDSSDSSSDLDDGTTSPAPDAGVMYSFDAAHGPSHGSQILNLALAKAEESFKDKETTKLVKSEYDVLDTKGEIVALTPVKKGKGKAGAEAGKTVDVDEDDYEFV